MCAIEYWSLFPIAGCNPVAINKWGGGKWFDSIRLHQYYAALAEWLGTVLIRQGSNSNVGSIPTGCTSFRMSSANFKAKLFGCLATKIILFFLFREIQARCRDLTVNQWLGEFDPHTRSQLLLAHYVMVAYQTLTLRV